VPAGSAAPAALLEVEEPVTVFPEGLRGVVKPYSERHRVQGFGDQAVTLAIDVGAPVVPVAITGPAQLYPLGVTPPGACWEIEFCEPIAPPPSSDDPWVVGDLVAQVRERIQERIDRRVLRAAIPRPPG
jgi:1-acyl-sn-glycerol-3-phosphate acyltransferase